MAFSAAGIAAVVVLILVLGVAVPQKVRFRQALADSRIEDRFSDQLRVVASASEPTNSHVVARKLRSIAAPNRGQREIEMTSDTNSSQATTNLLLAAGSSAAALTPTESAPVPSDPSELTRRREYLARRAKAAHRRLILVCALLLATATVWALVATIGLVWYWGTVPSALLVTVLALGMFAARQGRAVDRAWAERHGRRESSAESIAEPLLAASSGAAAPTESPIEIHTPVAEAAKPATQLSGTAEPTTVIARSELRPAVIAGRIDAKQNPAIDAQFEAPQSAAPTEVIRAPFAESSAPVEASVPLADDIAASATPTSVPDAARAADEVTVTTASSGPETAQSTWQPRELPRPLYLGPTATNSAVVPTEASLQSAAMVTRLESAPEPAPETSWHLGSPRMISHLVATEEPDYELTTDTLGLPLDDILARRRAS